MSRSFLQRAVCTGWKIGDGDPLNEPRRSDDEKLTKVCQRMNSFRSLYAIQVIPTFQHFQNIKYQIASSRE